MEAILYEVQEVIKTFIHNTYRPTEAHWHYKCVTVLGHYLGTRALFVLLERPQYGCRGEVAENDTQRP